ALIHVVSEVVDEVHAHALRVTFDTGVKVEVPIEISLAAGQVQHRATDAFNARHVDGQGVCLVGEVFGALGKNGSVSVGRVAHAQGKAGAARAVRRGKLAGKGIHGFVDQKIHAALTVERYRLGLVAAHGNKAELLEQVVQQRRVRSGVLDELELFDAERVGMRLTHGSISLEEMRQRQI